MNAPLPDDDLLALIEGELAPERVERIKKVLMRDPALVRRLEQMKLDRQRLKRAEQLFTAQPKLHDPRLVSDAVEQAEREALLHVGAARTAHTSRHRQANKRLRRRLTMVASLILGAGLLGVWSWVFITQTQPTPSPSSPIAAHTGTAPSQPVLALALPEKAELAGPPAVFDAIAGVDPVETQIPSGDSSLTDEWIKSAGLELPEEPKIASAPTIATSGISISEAARLALEGRLKLVTDRPPGTVVKAMAADPTAIPLAGPVIDLSALGTRAISREITIRVPSSADAQAEVERELAMTVQRLAVGSGASIRFVALDAPVTPPAPSMTFEDILWWSRPAAEWKPRVELRVPVELDEAAAQSPATTP